MPAMARHTPSSNRRRGVLDGRSVLRCTSVGQKLPPPPPQSNERAELDHGILFEVSAARPTLVRSLELRGALGVVRVFASRRRGPRAALDLPVRRHTGRAVADWRDWLLVGALTISPDEMVATHMRRMVLRLTVGVPVLQGGRRAFYVHCTMGIQVVTGVGSDNISI